MEAPLVLPTDVPVGAGYRVLHPSRLLRSSNQLSSDTNESVTASKPSDSTAMAQAARVLVVVEKQARRAQARVTEFQRSLHDKKEEEDKKRLDKLDELRRKRENEHRIKQRRRAEIYALNAILKQVQQDKLNAYIAAHPH